MLTDKDFKKLRKEMILTMGDFYTEVVFPHMDERFNSLEGSVKNLAEDMDDVQRKLDQNQKEHDRTFVKLDEVSKKIDGHERRIKKVEKVLQTL